MTSPEEKIFNLQCESTKKLLLAQSLRSSEEDADYISKIRFTPIILEAQCLKEDGTVDLNVRPITQEQADNYSSFRRKRGSIIQSLRTESNLSGVSDETKERATNAFMERFSLAAIKQKFESLMKGIFKPSYAEQVADALKRNL